MEILKLPLASIEVGTDRARDLDPEQAEALAESIRLQGLFYPILVRKIGDDYRLVDGRHRHEAFNLLGETDIPVIVSAAETDDAARMDEVMTNVARKMVALDLCHHLHELKQVWVRMHPQTGHGGDRKSAKIKFQNLELDPDVPDVPPFREVMAVQFGLSKSAILEAVAIWEGLSQASRTRLHCTDLADKKTELHKLSKLPPRQQVKVLDAILNDDLPDVGNVAQALAYLEGGIVCDPIEKRFAAVSKTIAELDDETFDSVIAVHEERVISSLKRRGRI